MTHRIRSFALAVVALLLGSAIAGAAAFHLHLEKSLPADKSEVATAPVDLQLWFSEETQLALTKVTLLSGNDTIPLEKPTRAAAPKSPVVAEIMVGMKPGPYNVRWRTMGKDGHAVTGAFAFVVK